MNEFDHFLVTRFNLRTRQWANDKNRGAILTDDWLQHRLGLFESYCLPSVIAQTTKNFTWLIYFSNDTDDPTRRHISFLTGSYPWIRILYVEDQTEFAQGIKFDIEKLRKPRNEFIITTRIDNDDVIHPEMVGVVQQNFRSQSFMAINFCLLYCLKVEGTPQLYCDISFSNHFISLIEKSDGSNMVGCYSRRDHEWNVKGSIYQVRDSAYCMELIHSRNMANVMKGFPVWKMERLQSFKINFTKRPVITISDFFVWKMPWRKLFAYIWHGV
jgi:hypothetical protein